MQNLHTVRRLSFRGRSSEASAFRRSFAAAFSEAASSGARLAPEAILCVRRMALTVRGQVRPRPEDRPLGDALRAEADGAAWPARGPVPAGANAVVFADATEMLACLARDWSAGETARWWWASLFPAGDFAENLGRCWLQEARAAPSALAALEAEGAAHPFLARCAPSTLRALWLAVTRAFALEELAAAWAPPTADVPPAGAPSAPDDDRTPVSAPPWHRWVPDEPAWASPAGQLRIVALMLARAPSVVRARSFAAEVAAWRVEAGRPPLPEKNPPKPNVAPEGTRPLGEPVAAAEPAVTQPFPASEKPPFSAENPRADRSSEAEEAWRREEAAATAPAAPGSLGKEEGAAVPREDAASPGETPPARASADRAPEVAPAAPWLPAPTIQTAWGGVFYLANVALSLGYYGDFANPGAANLDLPFWDFLTMLGGRFIGESWEADPLAGLFAQLSQRAENEPPAAGWEPPDGLSQAGWLELTAEQMSHRLMSALGSPEDFRALVFAHSAKVAASAARLDVSFSLTAHPIELRVAGLDRDPGWVPAAGLTLAFHYE